MGRKLAATLLMLTALLAECQSAIPADLDQPELGKILFDTIHIGSVLGPLHPFHGGNPHPFHWHRAIMSLLGFLPPHGWDPQLTITNKVFDGIPVRVYRPVSAPSQNAPGLIFIHGGGFVIEDLDSEDWNARYFAKNAGVVVISIGYRLAPEHPFPVPVEDCLKATVYTLHHAFSLGVDPYNVGITGYSAGGNLAVTTLLHLQEPRFSSTPRLRYQLLQMPILQAVDFSLPSFVDNDFGIGYSRQDVVTIYLLYAGMALSHSNFEQAKRGQHISPGSRAAVAKYVDAHLLNDNATVHIDSPDMAPDSNLQAIAEPLVLDPSLSPLLASDEAMRQMPAKAMIVTAHYDLVRDDALLYVKRLRDAGVDVTEYIIPNGHHASTWLMISGTPQSEASKRALEEMVVFIKSNS